MNTAKRIARLAGAFYLLVAIFALFALFAQKYAVAAPHTSQVTPPPPHTTSFSTRPSSGSAS